MGSARSNEIATLFDLAARRPTSSRKPKRIRGRRARKSLAGDLGEKASGPVRVLIAEDNPIVREVLEAVIAERDDFDLVGLADDADTAIELAKHYAPDVALLDVRMPGGGGARAAREIRDVCPETRVVALSSMDDHFSVSSMMSAGAVGYATKDMPVDEIFQTILRCARGASVFSPPAATDVMRDITDASRRAEEEERERARRVARVLAICRREAIDCVFQPVLGLDSGEAVMYESLTRFNSVERLSPGDCFGEAAEVGLSVELDLAAINAALDTINHVPHEDFTLSINVSPQTLLSPRLGDTLANVDPHRIVLEVTEHAQITDYASIKRVLGVLRGRGMRLAIDDAGAGFASLRHILDLMPDLIKLDITLSRDIDTDTPRRALATGLISFAREIGAKIVAEGIETEAELETLRELGVDYGQGYYLARPAPLRELAIHLPA